MNRKNLTAAVLAGLLGFASTAQAVNVNPDGLGQVLFYPYYTTNGDNTTLLSVVNTTDNAKAVKVRFMESQNSREVLDFNLYLSAHDVWAAAITDVDGVPTLISNDTSCSAPYLYEMNDGKQEFLPWAMNDMGGTTIAELEEESYRMSEGHIEIIEMGTVVGESAVAVTHVASTDGGPAKPADCAVITEAWTNRNGTDNDGYWITDPTVDMLAPSGGLFGGVSVINVGDGTLYGYDATAINGFASVLGDLHQVPGTVLPILNSGDVKVGTVFMDDGTIKESTTFLRGVDAVSYVLMHNNVMNEYNVNTNVGAKTEWVITFPTKSFYVDTAVSETLGSVAPFTSTWDSVEGGACETVLIDAVYDREEQTVVAPVGEELPPLYSPQPPVPPVAGVDVLPFDLCWETNVIQFGPIPTDPVTTPSSVLGSYNTVHLDPTILGFDSGWIDIELDDYVDAEGDDQSRKGLGGLEGLPAVGFAVSRFSNGFLTDEAGNNVLANYGGIFSHKATRKMSSDVQ